MTPIHIGGTYEHVKTGKIYKIIAVGKNSETLEDLVVYEAQYQHALSRVWVRPLESFTGEAKSADGGVHPRFKYVSK